ncbi:MAG: hypothetical protein Tsb0032_25090 [Kiloniellaceae bacterium]
MDAKKKFSDNPFAAVEASVAAVLDAPPQALSGLADIANLDPATDFQYADLRDLDLHDEDLSTFDFRGADLRRANLSGARINQASLDGANLEGAELKDIRFITTLLIVENDDQNRSLYSRTLRSKGFDVLHTGSGEAAREILSQQRTRVRMLITDIILPDLDGFALVEAVRRAHPRLKVLFISGFSCIDNRVRSYIERNRGVDFLAKPFELKVLRERVDELLEKAI